MDLFFLVESIPLSVPGHTVTNGIWMLSSPAYPEVFSRERKIWFFQPLPNENPYVVEPSEIRPKNHRRYLPQGRYNYLFEDLRRVLERTEKLVRVCESGF